MNKKQKAGYEYSEPASVWIVPILFYLRNEVFKCLRIVHRQVSKNLTIQLNSFLLKLVDELRISNSFFTACRIDTGDPQLAIISFLQLTTYKHIGHPFFNYVLGNGINVFTFAIKSFGLL